MHAALEGSYMGISEQDQRKISVESSFKLDLPPHLIIPSASIKLNETIGQGMCFLPDLTYLIGDLTIILYQ